MQCSGENDVIFEFDGNFFAYESFEEGEEQLQDDSCCDDESSCVRTRGFQRKIFGIDLVMYQMCADDDRRIELLTIFL